METKTGMMLKNFRNWLAIGAVVLGFLYIFLITFVPIPDQNIRFADTVLGVVIGTIISTVFQYYFGSSQGSNEKQKILNQNISKSPENE